MPSPYDILINLQAKAEEVKAAAAAVSNLVQQVQGMGPALATNIQKGDAATQTLTRDLKEASAAAVDAGRQGGAAGTATAAGMEKAATATKRFNDAAGRLREANGQFVKVGESADEAGHKAGGFREMFEQAFAFGIGNQVVEKLLEIPTRLAEGFTEALHAGVEFNAEMETLGIGVAASMRQADPGHLLDFKSAQVAGSAALDALREKANTLGLDFKSLAETFQINLRVMTEAGITDLQQQISTVLNLTQAAASKGLSGFQAQRDIIDLLNGKGDRTIFAKELGISDDDIKTATQAGNLYGFLAEKLSAYGEAGNAAASTFAAASQRLHNQVAQLEGALAKPLFDVLKKGADELAAVIGGPGFQQSFGVLAAQIGTAATAVVNFSVVLLPLLPTVIELGKDIVALSVALGVGALITALSNAATAAGGFGAVLVSIGPRIAAMLTALGPAGLIIGAATAALLLLDHAMSEYVARARELLALVGQFGTVLASLQSQINAADTPEKKEAGYLALLREQTTLIERQEALKRAGGDQVQIDAVGNQLLQIKALIAEYDNLAGKKAKAGSADEQAGKFPALAKETQEEDDKQYESGLDHIQQHAKAQGEFDAKRLAATKVFGLAETASYEDIKRAAQSLRETQKEVGDKKPALIDTGSLEREVELYKQQFAKIQTVVKQAQDKEQQGGTLAPHISPSQIDPNYDLNVKTAEELTTKLADAQKALAAAQATNATATGTNTSSLRGSNAEAARQLQVYKDLQKLHEKLDDTSKSAQTLQIQRQEADIADRLAKAKLAAGPNNITPEVRDLEIQGKELRYQQEYSRQNNGLDQEHIKLAHDRAVAEVDVTIAKKDGAKATRDANAAAKLQHGEELASDRDRKTALLSIRDQLQEIQKDPFTTNEQKQAGEKPLLEAELALLERNIAERQKLIQLYANDPKKAEEVARLKQENVQDLHTGDEASQQLRGMNFAGDLKKQAVDLENTWGTVSHSIASSITQTIGTAVDGLSNALTGLITGTKTWQQALTQVGESIIQMLIRIAVQQTVGRALVYAVNLAYTAAESATSSAAAGAAASSWATAAVLASVATYGVAAGAGLAALTSAIASGDAIAAGSAAVSGGFAEGGLIPGRPSQKDNRLIHVATGEYIVRTSAVQHYGPGFFDSLNKMQVARNGFATGGLVGNQDGYSPILMSSSPNVDVRGHQVTLVQVRDRNELLQTLQSSEGRKIVLGHVAGNKTRVGIRS